MPTLDRRKGKEYPIEYEAVETLAALPARNRVTLVLVTDGKASITLNGRPMTVFAPCVLCLSERDSLEVISNNRLYAQSFSLAPSYLKNLKSFMQIKSGLDVLDANQYARDVLTLFYKHDENFNGVLKLPPQAYLRVFEWLCVIGTEIRAQSDGRWTCRVRSYFMMILNLLDEINESREVTPDVEPLASPVDTVMEYIHTHYMEELTLDKLCGLVNVNRTSLSRRYKERTGQNVIEYLINYRLAVARELLAHTGLTIGEIARRTGFGYDTYLIRRFTEKNGETPTEYRKASRVRNGIIIVKE